MGDFISRGRHNFLPPPADFRLEYVRRRRIYFALKLPGGDFRPAIIFRGTAAPKPSENPLKSWSVLGVVAVAAGVRQTACSESTDTLTSSTGTINSPGYSSGSYPNNAYCQWLIQAPASKVRLCSKGKKVKVVHTRLPSVGFRS